MSPTAAERFWAKVEKTDTCWLWTASLARGRGRFHYGRRGHSVYASRFAYELTRGVIPEGMGVLHHCDVPRCVNPDHLFLGDQKANMADAARKGRIRNTPRYGSAHSTAKLTESIVLEVRKAHRDGSSIRGLARKYGVHPKTMSRAISGERWSHVPQETAVTS